MMTRKEWKQKAKQSLKKHYWIFVAACIIAGWIGSNFSNVLDPLKIQHTESALQSETSSSGNILDDRSNANATDAILEAINGDPKEGQQISSSIEKKEADYYSPADTHKILGRQRGVLAGILNCLSSGSIMVDIISALDSIDNSSGITIAILIVLSLTLNIMIWVFITNVFRVVVSRIFLEGRIYNKVPIQRFLFLLRIKKWAKASFTMLLTFLFQTLWSFTIIGGVIKHYSYYLVPYIVAENPDIPSRTAINLSRHIMKGHKWECFLIDLSFLGWYILGLVSFGIMNTFYVTPYREATFCEYYTALRAGAKEEKIADSEYLNDEFLYRKVQPEELLLHYSDIEDLKKLPVISIDSIHGIRGFLAKTFGLALFPWKEERAYEASQERQVRIASMQDTMDGQVYPTRLYPIPEQIKRKHMENVHYLRLYSVWSVLLLFFSFSFIGWIWEVSLHLISDGDFVNRGVLHGPWLPIYGAGGVLILLVLNRLRAKPLAEFTGIIILCGIVEYSTSYVLEIMHNGKKWWDYSGYFLNLNGRICAEGLLVFGLGGLAIVYIVAPLLDNHFRKLRMNVIIPLCIGLLACYMTDTIYSVKHPNEGKGITDYESRIEIKSPNDTYL